GRPKLAPRTGQSALRAGSDRSASAESTPGAGAGRLRGGGSPSPCPGDQSLVNWRQGSARAVTPSCPTPYTYGQLIGPRPNIRARLFFSNRLFQGVGSPPPGSVDGGEPSIGSAATSRVSITSAAAGVATVANHG